MLEVLISINYLVPTFMVLFHLLFPNEWQDSISCWSSNDPIWRLTACAFSLFVDIIPWADFPTISFNERLPFWQTFRKFCLWAAIRALSLSGSLSSMTGSNKTVLSGWLFLFFYFFSIGLFLTYSSSKTPSSGCTF